MVNLSETLKEYFFGTETRKWCQWKDSFYREHFEDKRGLEVQLYDSRIGQLITKSQKTPFLKMGMNGVAFSEPKNLL